MNTLLSKEIGGYFSLECGHTPLYHQNGIMLNSARNALRYIIKAYNIKEIAVPYYTCPVVWQAIQIEGCRIIPYDIDDKFLPQQEFSNEIFILYNNYFGICHKNIDYLAQKYKNLIIDNAQAFYAAKQGIASFYSPRKFFGLPDGGIAICDKVYEENFETAVSYNLCSHLLKRLDLGAQSGYKDFQQNEDSFIEQPIQYMSLLTRSLMGNIDYERAKIKRLENFCCLHQALKKKNGLSINLSDDDVPMIYPFKTDDLSLRQKLIQNKIFVAKYWPKEENNACMASIRAQTLADTIIPLPIDQRYDVEDMKHILSVIPEEI